MTIRPYHPDDIESVYSVFYHSIHEVAKKDYTPQQLAVWGKPQRNTHRWDEGLLKQHVWIAEQEGKITGFISLRPESGYLDFLFVHHQYQGQGIASRLLHTLEAEARTLGIHQLTTDSSLTARPFFLSKGFQLLEENTKTVDGIDFLNSRMGKML